jgi:hypothetical protein
MARYGGTAFFQKAADGSASNASASLTIPTPALTEVTMANSSSTATAVAGKSFYIPSPQAEMPSLIDGLVHHALVTASTQVKILGIVDETGSANIGDIVEALGNHPDPVGAVMVMVRLNILVLALRGPLDANTMVSRAKPEADPEAPAVAPQVPPGDSDASAVKNGSSHPRIPASLERLAVNPFRASVVIGPGSSRRDFARIDDLRRPGVYGLMNATSLYIGMGSDVGQRVSTGQQPIEGIETIFVITDADNMLSADAAAVAERILWSRATGSSERKMANGVPDGAPVDPQLYSHLDAFVAEACLALRHDGLLFNSGSARSVLAGPRAEPGRFVLQRPFNEVPDGEVMELVFNEGRIAMAAKRAENDWLLLRGSDVRPETVASANASASFLRAAWLHSGILMLSHDGQSYTLTRDMPFRSGGAAMHFVTGSKGRGRGGWQSIDPDGGYDPRTAALIAS